MDLLKWWQIEQNSPKWFKDANSLWGETWDDFNKFCQGCDRIYDLGDVIIYVQKDQDSANIHIGAVRHARIDIKALCIIRDKLLIEFQVVYGWVLRHNRGIAKLANAVGMTFNGVRMFRGESRGRLLEWRCHAMSKNNFQIP